MGCLGGFNPTMTAKLPKKIARMFIATDHTDLHGSNFVATPYWFQIVLLKTGRSVAEITACPVKALPESLLFVNKREVRLVTSVFHVFDRNEMEGGRINHVTLPGGRLRVGKDMAEASVTSLGAHLRPLHLV